MRIKKVHEMVKAVLTEYPDARDSTAICQTRVIEKFYGTEYLYQPYIMTVEDTQLPNIESVGRAKRKCQELYPELRASDNVEAACELKEEEYRDYARKHS